LEEEATKLPLIPLMFGIAPLEFEGYSVLVKGRGCLAAALLLGSSGCADMLYFDKSEPDRGYRDCLTLDPCRYVVEKRLRSDPPWLDARKRTVEVGLTDGSAPTGSQKLSFLWEYTPLGFLAPFFGYPEKLDGGYEGGVTLSIQPIEAARAISSEAGENGAVVVPFAIPRGSTATVTLDFNRAAREELAENGRAVFYTPGTVEIAVDCDPRSCRARATPPGVLATAAGGTAGGAISLAEGVVEDRRRLKELAAPEESRASSKARQTEDERAADRRAARGQRLQAARRARESEEFRRTQERSLKSVDELVVLWSAAKGRCDFQTLRDLAAGDGGPGITVALPATLTSVDRSRRRLKAYSAGWTDGAAVDVDYAGSNMEDYFSSTDPKCCTNRYRITGVVTGDPARRVSEICRGRSPTGSEPQGFYIKAEKIEPLRE
jgi:hypothetical protein